MNMCCVGGAGAGKSETCELIVSDMNDIRARVAIVAPSGTAAVNVHARTLHSLFGLGKNTKGIEELVRKMKSPVKERIQKTDTIIIDKISMVSSETFDRMDQIARAAREEPEKPFGGMQIIVFGDLCQLPPVKPHERCFRCGEPRKLVTTTKRKRGGPDTRVWRCKHADDHGDIPNEDKMWAFKSTQWNHVGFVYVPLHQAHRQQDPTFLNILANVRYGKQFTSTEVDLLMNHQCDVTNAVNLVWKRDEAARINDDRLNDLPGVPEMYDCQDDFIWQRNLHPELKETNNNIRGALREYPYELDVYLKKGQPVILQRNINVGKGLVNGSQGVIEHFVNYNDVRQQRQNSLEDVQISQLRADHIRDFMRHQRRIGNSAKLPVAEFNNYPEPVTIFPDCGVEELGYKKPHSLLMRTQIPPLSGWALTIYKAQGMTLEKATVTLGDYFACGMMYVASSRVKTLTGLRVLDLTPTSSVHPVNEEVKAFLQQRFRANFD